MSMDNLKRWQKSGEAEKWVQDHVAGWTHDEWQGLLDSLRQTDYWPMEESDLSEAIESLRKKLKRAADSHQDLIDKERRVLVDLAFPSLYRRNLFRILELSITATAADVRRRQKRQEMQRKLGIDSGPGKEHPLALNPPPAKEEINAALDRMNEPQTRLLDEIFWFWPAQNDGPDAALEAIEQGRIEEARSLWTNQVKQEQNARIAVHNLAVLEHLQILDKENELGTCEREKDLAESLDQRWMHLFQQWQGVCEGEEFWDRVKVRVRELNDARLTTGFVRRIRKTLPKALLMINARMACSAADRGDLAMVQRCLGQMQSGPWGSDLVEEALLEALRPSRDHIKAMIDHAKSRWSHDPVHGNRYVRELHSQALAQLVVMDRVLTEGHSVRTGLHEMVANAMLDGQVAFGKKTNDWTECIDLLNLALGLGIGESVRAQFEENIKVLNENQESANDWCSPGYWDLPPEILERLESIRRISASGDFDKAIESLAVLDPGIGQPLKRCLAHCLSIKGIRLFNEAISEYNTETDVLKAIMNRLRSMNETTLGFTLMRRPTPETSMHMLPPCLSCGGSYYNSWVNFKYKDIPLFMCSACSAKNERQIEQQKKALRGSIHKALEYLLLAQEIDPHDPGIQRNLKIITETGRNFNCSSPATKNLKERLCAAKYRERLLEIETVPEDNICFFCSDNPAEPACRLTVPMCGDKKLVDLIFQEGYEYHYADVIVPRCQSCCDEHRQYPERVRQWEQDRLAAADDCHFPSLHSQMSSAENIHAAKQRSVKALREKLEALQSSKSSFEPKSKCEKCGSQKFWKGQVCRQCHPKAFHPGYYKRFLALAAFCFVAADLLLWNLPFLDTSSFKPGGLRAAITVLPAGILFLMMKWPQWKLRRRLWEQERQLQIRQKDREKAQMEKEIEKACQEEQAAASALRDLKQKLQHVKQKAIEEFERSHARPLLLANIRSENDFLQFRRICEFREKGWKFGRSPAEEKDLPVEVGGLTRASVKKSSPAPDTERKRLLELIRQTDDDEFIECPVCKVRKKAKNMIRHYDNNHKTGV
ncbi:MAG: hypothetical protein R2940_15665 [Syntrophotaleaceae bacterium]